MNQLFWQVFTAFITLFGFDAVTRGGIDGAVKRGFAFRILRWLGRNLRDILIAILEWGVEQMGGLLRGLGRAAWRQIRRFFRWAWANHPWELAGVVAGISVALAGVFFWSRLP